MSDEPILRLGDAVAFLIHGVGRGGRAHYVAASERLSAQVGRTITVAQRPSGRPRLSGVEPELGVSLSWREGSLLVGYSPTTNVGVDLEPDDATLDAPRMARDHFTAGETNLVTGEKTPALQRDLFLRLWVAKEAVLKTTGRGIYDGLEEPDLSARGETLRSGAVIPIPPSPHVQAADVMVTRVQLDGIPRLYLALARSSS